MKAYISELMKNQQEMKEKMKQHEQYVQELSKKSRKNLLVEFQGRFGNDVTFEVNENYKQDIFDPNWELKLEMVSVNGLVPTSRGWKKRGSSLEPNVERGSSIEDVQEFLSLFSEKYALPITLRVIPFL